MNIEKLEKLVSSSEKKVDETAVKKAAFDVDWSKIKGNVNWDAIKQKLSEMKNWYGRQGAGTRALIGAGVGLGGGALLGKLMGRTGAGAIAGALAGAGTGAYWKDVLKAIDAVKPVAVEASDRTKKRLAELVNNLPKSTRGESQGDGEAKAISTARDSAGVSDSQADKTSV